MDGRIEALRSRHTVFELFEYPGQAVTGQFIWITHPRAQLRTLSNPTHKILIHGLHGRTGRLGKSRLGQLEGSRMAYRQWVLALAHALLDTVIIETLDTLAQCLRCHPQRLCIVIK